MTIRDTSTAYDHTMTDSPAVAPPSVSSVDPPSIPRESPGDPPTGNGQANGSPDRHMSGDVAYVDGRFVPVPTPGHDSKGRFTTGNKGRGRRGPRVFVDHRAALRAAISPEDVYKCGRMMLAAAVKGNLTALRDVLDRTLGRPEASVTIAHTSGGQRARADVLADLAGRMAALPPAQRAMVVARLGLPVDLEAAGVSPMATGSSVTPQPIVDAAGGADHVSPMATDQA